MMELRKTLIAISCILCVHNTITESTETQTEKVEDQTSVPKIVQDVKGNLSCYTCSSLFGNDCWMANTSHDMRLQLSLPDTSGHRTLDSLGSDLLSLSAPSTPQSSVSIVMHSMPVAECSPEEKYCQVTRVEYSKAEEQSPNRRFWALERRCATTCLEGCISIGDGERTRLYLCMSCCGESLCNVSDGVSGQPLHYPVMIILLSLIANKF